MKSIYLPALLLLFICSCVKEYGDSSASIADSTLDVNISTLAVNGGSDPYSYENENRINRAFVFIFNDKAVLENPGNTSVTAQTSTGEVIAEDKTLNASYKVTTGEKTIYVIANPTTDIAEELTQMSSKNGLTPDAIEAYSKVTDFPPYWSNDYETGFLMAGKASATAVSGKTTVVPITLERRLARIVFFMRRGKDLENVGLHLRSMDFLQINETATFFGSKTTQTTEKHIGWMPVLYPIKKIQSDAGQISQNPEDYTWVDYQNTYATEWKKNTPVIRLNCEIVTDSNNSVQKQFDVVLDEDVSLDGNKILQVLLTLSSDALDFALNILDWDDTSVNGDIIGTNGQINKKAITLVEGTNTKDIVTLTGTEGTRNPEIVRYEYNQAKSTDKSILPSYISITESKINQGLSLKIESDGNFDASKEHSITVYYRIGNIIDYLVIKYAKPNFGVSAIDEFSFAGSQTNDYVVNSTLSYNNGDSEPIAWWAEFSEDNGQTWKTQKPDWLTTFTSYASGGEGKKYQAKVAPQIGLNEHNERLKATPSVSGVYNLANQTNGGADIENTANCYIVNAPGTYSIPLVYGNAIKNGVTNKEAYHRDELTSDEKVYSEDFILDMLRHDGQPITSPYISGAASASLIWEDEHGLISDVKLSTAESNIGAIEFTVSSESIRQGNAIVAVKNSAGEVLWSWHVWVTDFKLSDPTTTWVNTENQQFEFMNVNLGWCDPIEYDERRVLIRFHQEGTDKTETRELIQAFKIVIGNCSLYNWGRKDPVGALLWDENSNYLGIKPDFRREYETVTPVNRYDDAVKNGIIAPGKVIENNGIEYTNAWDNARTGYSSDVQAGDRIIKTVYDPSPVGFHVSERAAFMGMDSYSSSYDNRYKMWTVRYASQSLMLPTTGRFHKNYVGEIRVYDETYYWLSESNMGGLSLSDMSLQVLSYKLGFLVSSIFPVRCVKED